MTDPLRAYAVELLHRADILPDAAAVAILARAIPLIESDIVGLVDLEA